MKNDNYVVTKSQFLNAIVDIANAMQHRDAAKAVNHFVNRGQDTVSGDQTLDMALELEPSLPEWKIERIRTEGEQVDKLGFARLMLKYCVARYGVGLFYLSEFDNELVGLQVRRNTSDFKAKEEAGRVSVQVTKQDR